MKYQILNKDCMEIMKTMKDNIIDLTLTDIPYGMVNRQSNGLRNLDKKEADILTFNLSDFLNEVYRITKGTIIIFCGVNQISEIYLFFAEKQKKETRNCTSNYLGKIKSVSYEWVIYLFKWNRKCNMVQEKNSTFNAYCSNTVFKYPCGRSKLHPTEKNHDLLKRLILDNSNEGDLLFDPCMGSGSHLLVGLENGRKAIGVELNKNFYDIANERLKKIIK